MNNATQSAQKINNADIRDYIERGGEFTSITTLNAGQNDWEVNILEAKGCDGVYVVDNEGVYWIDFRPFEVEDAYENWDSNAFPFTKYKVSKIAIAE